MTVRLMSFCILQFAYYVGSSKGGSSNDSLPTMSVHLTDGSPTMSVRLFSKGLLLTKSAYQLTYVPPNLQG